MYVSSEDKTKYPSSFDEDMKSIAREKFAWKPTDNVEKKIAECIKQLRDTLEKRRLVGNILVLCLCHILRSRCHFIRNLFLEI